MSYDEYISYASEIKQLEDMLACIPAEQVISRMGLQSRLESARNAIAGCDVRHLSQKARLTFKGKPVSGSHGATAEFASKASLSFTEAFSAVVAGISDNLRYMGPIPDKDKNQLLITGTAIGSFGFEFELPSDVLENSLQQEEFFPQAEKPRNRPELAMQKLEKLFQVAAMGTDDEIAELVDEIHPRAVKKASEFLDYLAEQDAWCGLEFQETVFRFGGVGQVRETAARLKANNIRETEETHQGEFQGVLPRGRTFEFKVSKGNLILRGKVGADIEDADILNRQFLHENVSVNFLVIQVGQGRPRYTLQALSDIKV